MEDIKLEEMTLDQVNQRLADLDAEVRAMVKPEDVDKAIELKTKILERKSELDAIESCKKTEVELIAGSVEAIKIDSMEFKREERNMDFTIETVLSSPEYRSAYLKNMQGKELNDVEKRAYSTASGYGAEVVPTSTANKVITKVYQIAPVLSHMSNLFHVPGNLKWAIQGTDNDPTLHTENAAITPANDTLTEISLGAYEITKALRVSRTVSAMSIDAFENFLVQLLASNMARKLEDLVFNGDGSSKPTGIVKAGSGSLGAYQAGTDLVSIAAATAVAEADVLNFYGMIGNHQSVRAYMSKPTFLDYFYPLMNVGKNISVKFVNGQFFIMDAPVFFTDSLGKGVAYLASLDYMVGNFADDIKILRSEHSGFLNNSIDFLAVCAFDCKPVIGMKAFAKFVKAQS
ncbi:MAG: phage major capsid protein [Youngiibacter sp.]|nr:phage major capsid protein [Youngiibacter sp.]